jgi:hypothetical protein
VLFRSLHYKLTVPEQQRSPLTVEVKVNYRKFDTIYFNYTYASNYVRGGPLLLTNDLPVTLLASDRLEFEIEGGANGATASTNAPSKIPEWQRWNDYGIGLFLKGDKGSEKGELIQAAGAFNRVESLGRADGPLNLARVFFKEGRLDDAVAALQRAIDDGAAPQGTPPVRALVAAAEVELPQVLPHRQMLLLAAAEVEEHILAPAMAQAGQAAPVWLFLVFQTLHQ